MDARDREILRLAVPAFGALVAEPLYVLADTAIVGHLGTHQLGGLGVAGAVLTATFGVFNFLAYGTTAIVARHLGAGDERSAAEHGVAGMWLALALGIGLTVLGLIASNVVVHAMGASSHVAPYALTYLRISLLGAPFVLLALAGTGYLRGLQDTRTPLYIALAANTFNLALEVVLVYGIHLGVAGSAWGTVVAQIGAAAAYLVIVRHNLRRAHASARPRRDRCAPRRLSARTSPCAPHRCCSRSRRPARSPPDSVTCRSPPTKSRGSCGGSLPCASTQSRSRARPSWAAPSAPPTRSVPAPRHDGCSSGASWSGSASEFS